MRHQAPLNSPTKIMVWTLAWPISQDNQATFNSPSPLASTADYTDIVSPAGSYAQPSKSNGVPSAVSPAALATASANPSANASASGNAKSPTAASHPKSIPETPGKSPATPNVDTSSDAPSSSSSLTGPVIGSVVALLVFIAAVVGGVWFLHRRRQKARMRQEATRMRSSNFGRFEPGELIHEKRGSIEATLEADLARLRKLDSNIPIVPVSRVNVLEIKLGTIDQRLVVRTGAEPASPISPPYNEYNHPMSMTTYVHRQQWSTDFQCHPKYRCPKAAMMRRDQTRSTTSNQPRRLSAVHGHPSSYSSTSSAAHCCPSPTPTSRISTTPTDTNPLQFTIHNADIDANRKLITLSVDPSRDSKPEQNLGKPV
ncbi:hypothetical protein H4Q26_015876 [Puccinia striiformis f. sp. tritici PST-130]|nr:hypothetical protein H4Q26_015876 [Puccinia striiformis f. sp. tritici PST-130]